MTAAQKQCPDCQKTAPLEAQFCMACGHRFQMNFIENTNAHRTCNTCGRMLGSFEAACTQCAERKTAPTSLTRSAPGVPAMPASNPYDLPASYTPSMPPAQVPHVQCVGCRQWVPQGVPQCNHCGALMPAAPPPAAYVQGNQAPVQQVIIQNAPYPMQTPQYPMTPYRPQKDKTAAGLLSILLGTFGGQHFYLGNVGAGILSILFSWTYIPTLIGVIQGITYLCMDEQEFHRRHG